MAAREPGRRIYRRGRTRRIRGAGLLVVIAAIAAALGVQLLASSSSTASFSSTVQAPATDPPTIEVPRSEGAAHGQAGGAVPEGTTVFDDWVPGVGNLDPALLDVLHRAAWDAAHDGIELEVDSGWRSPEYQQRLLDEATATYGSQAAAARWVATPDTSAHVSGDAVDIGPAEATAWLAEHGAMYGLCQIYDNEPWHYELRPEAVDLGCPPTYADPTHDPRMQR
jgi:D-alanyl-D-alanine carboxypeptidase